MYSLKLIAKSYLADKIAALQGPVRNTREMKLLLFFGGKVVMRSPGHSLEEKMALNMFPVYYDGVKQAVLLSMDKLGNIGRSVREVSHPLRSL